MNSMYRRLTTTGLVSLIAIVLLAGQGLAAPADETTLHVIHMNDMFARVEEEGESIGYAKIAAYVQQFRDKGANILVLDAGDALHGRPLANLSRGENIVTIMDAVGFDAMVPGDQDFTYGHERLKELAATAEFPIIAANVYLENGERLLEPYVIKNVGGLKAAVFGLVTPAAAYGTLQENVRGLTFADPVAEARQMAAELKDKADFIIALSHLGFNADPEAPTGIKVAQAVPDIDLVVDGHSVEAPGTATAVGPGLVVQGREYGQSIGHVEIALDGEFSATGKEAKLLPYDHFGAQAADEKVAALIARLSDETDAALSEVVGTTLVHLVGDSEHIWVGETNLGNFIADIIRQKADAAVGLMNGGSFRTSLPAGEITVGHVLSVAQHRNSIQTLSVSGADIVAALEHGVSSYPKPFGGFPQVSGLRFEIHPGGPPGQRVQNVRIGDGPVDLTAEYLLATNNFLAAGGDNYAMLAKYPVVGEFGLIEDAVMEHLRQAGPVNPAVDHRIKVVEPGSREPEPSYPGETPPQKVHVVQRGDTLWGIGRKYGTTWPVLQQMNQIKNADLIYPGQIIVIP